MKFSLKKYQARVLARLEEFLDECKLSSIADAYTKVAHRKDDKGKPENRYASEYQAIGGLDNCPHVCLRVPTGGGKTYLAALSLRPIARYRETDAPTVLWFTPSEAVREQTVEMLNNPNHPCRIALGEMFGNMLQICDVSDFTNLRPQDFTSHTTIIVTTAQMFRVQQTARNVDGMTKSTRKIYETNEALEPHFAQFCPQHPPQELIRDDNGEVLLSFANLLHLLRPAVILDEAHGFVSDLSREVLRRINPACVIEWTATPREKNGAPLHNVLASATAEELRNEQMIKMPVRLVSHLGWERAINGAVNERKRLAELARESGDAVRPIALYKAQNANEDVHVEKLKQHLIEENGIAEDTIAIATGEIKELADINLLAADCRIEHIITVEALREGWDCSFAYLLCVVDNMRSTTAVEQLLGRVLRMPFAEKRKHPELNCAYAHVSATNFVEAVRALREKIATELGFDESEIEEVLQSSMQISDTASITEHERHPGAILRLEHIPNFSSLPDDERFAAHAAVSAVLPREYSGEEGIPVRLNQPITQAVQDILVGATAAANREEQARKIKQVNDALTANRPPAETGEQFSPMMQLSFVLPDENKRMTVDPHLLGDAGEWNDLGDNFLLPHFSINETSTAFTIELVNNKMEHIQTVDYQISLLPGQSVAVDADVLSGWLQKEIRASEARYFSDTLQTFVDANIKALQDKGIELAQLTRAKYVLALALKNWLAAHAEKVMEEARRRMLFTNDDLRCDIPFRFEPNGYLANKFYTGPHRFNKHYYRQIGAIDNDEEAECAQYLDGMPEVKHWVRNMPRTEKSFKLPSKNDWFYPDFVAELTNGKVLVVEYKGEGYWDGSKFDRDIGELWEANSDGNQFFIMVGPQRGQPSVDTQLREKIADIIA